VEAPWLISTRFSPTRASRVCRFAGQKQYKVRDSELPGFSCSIGKRRKSFMAQGEFWRDGVREFAAQVKLGDFGDMTTREARGKAREALGAITRGQRPGEAPKIEPGSITLRQAWEHYRDAHMKRKGRNPGTIENYRDHMERLFEDWLDKPLARLGRQPTLVVERHDKITKENGPLHRERLNAQPAGCLQPRTEEQYRSASRKPGFRDRLE
jgi:Arm DNA-binding domain